MGKDIVPAFFGFLMIAFVVVVLATHPNFIKTSVSSAGGFVGDVIGAGAHASHRGA